MTTLRTRRIAPALLVLLLVASGCTATPLAPGSTAPPSVPPTPSEPPLASPGKLCAKEFEGCTIAAGAYSSAPFEPAFTFTIPEGWTNARAWPHGGGVTYGEGGFWWIVGVKAGALDGNEVEIEESAEGVLAHLARFKGFEIGEPKPVTVDGASGVQVDVATGQTPAQGLLFLEEDHFNLGPGQKARFLLVEREATFVIFIVEAFNEADFDSVVENVQPVLDSVRWR